MTHSLFFEQFHLFFDYGALTLLFLYVLVRFGVLTEKNFEQRLFWVLIIFASVSVMTMLFDWNAHFAMHGIH